MIFFQRKEAQSLAQRFAKGLLVSIGVLVFTLDGHAEAVGMRVIVNSNEDGGVLADDRLTLREAIEIVNGSLSLDRLSARERQQVISGETQGKNEILTPRIEFNLPEGKTTIYLQNLLPALQMPVIIDGNTQPKFVAGEKAIIPKPEVAITAAANKEIFRGFTVVSSGVTIRGLSLYGFSYRHRSTASSPPADIFIANRSWYMVNGEFVSTEKEEKSSIDNAPKDVVIEYNWLGISPEQEGNKLKQNNTEENNSLGNLDNSPGNLKFNSAFGVSVFNSFGTKIYRNRISQHDGSAIITGVRSQNLVISDNIIEYNGFRGMPDAIRLEGDISNTQILFNQIRDNAGSAIYLFKPEGAAEIRENLISNNGQAYRRAAIYLMGNNNQVLKNQIRHQSGPGVVVTAYPNSQGNFIKNNRFSDLAGLSIDLVTQLNTDIFAYQIGDGRNPPMTSWQRRRKTGNFGIDAPRFISKEFFINNGKVTLLGQAEAGTEIEIYRVEDNALSESLGTVTCNSQGKFAITLDNLKPGDKVSALVNHVKYGTSEPAVNAVIRDLK